MKLISDYKKGEKVRYQGKMYPLQSNDNSLRIVHWENGKRKNISLKKVLFWIFEPGSEQDYIFNGRFIEFRSLEEYQVFLTR